MKKSIGAQTIVYPTPAFVIGTYDASDNPNGATAAWSGICCSRPPCIAVSFRKATLTYHNIIKHAAFTVNVPSETYVKETDYFGIASGRNENKFIKSKLTPVKSTVVHAPYIEEFPFCLECKLIHTLELGLHTMFIGEILDIKADENLLDEKGYPAITKVKPVIFAPSIREYFGIGDTLGKAFSIGKEIGDVT